MLIKREKNGVYKHSYTTAIEYKGFNVKKKGTCFFYLCQHIIILKSINGSTSHRSLYIILKSLSITS